MKGGGLCLDETESMLRALNTAEGEVIRRISARSVTASSSDCGDCREKTVRADGYG